MSKFYASSFFSTKVDRKERWLAVLKYLLLSLRRMAVKAGLVTALAVGAVWASQHVAARRGLPQPTAVARAVGEKVGDGLRRGAELKDLLFAGSGDEHEHSAHAEQEGGLKDALWVLATCVAVVPLISQLPGGSPVLGFLLGGALIGPYATGIIQHVDAVSFIAEFGVVFLM